MNFEHFSYSKNFEFQFKSLRKIKVNSLSSFTPLSSSSAPFLLPSAEPSRPSSRSQHGRLLHRRCDHRPAMSAFASCPARPVPSPLRHCLPPCCALPRLQCRTTTPAPRHALAATATHARLRPCPGYCPPCPIYRPPCPRPSPPPSPCRERSRIAARSHCRRSSEAEQARARVSPAHAVLPLPLPLPPRTGGVVLWWW